MVSKEDEFFNQMLDPEHFSLETIKYQQTLILQQMRIDRSAASCLGGNPHEQRSKINELYGAVYNLVTNLVDSSNEKYQKTVGPFLKINVWNKKFSREKNLISLFHYIMAIHRLNINEYARYGLKPAKKKALWMATKEDIRKDIKKQFDEMGGLDD